MSIIILEVCTDSVHGAVAAQAGGAHRIELCSDLLEGGVTPSYGLIKQVRSCLHACKLHILIRPRPGDFLYSDGEMEVMRHDIHAAAGLGVDGVVIGCLDGDGGVDIHKTRSLVDVAVSQGLTVTFHRAFDMCRDLRSSLEDIIALGIPRVLTSGGCRSAALGTEVIRGLVDQSAGRVQVMAGGGITEHNAAQLVRCTGVMELHGSARRPLPSRMAYRKPDMSLSADPSSEYEPLVTNADTVRAILAEANKALKELQS